MVATEVFGARRMAAFRRVKIWINSRGIWGKIWEAKAERRVGRGVLILVGMD